jgi:nitrite reductase/ring-hydroxylating ferredoxin subunit
MAWIKALEAEALPEGERREVELHDHKILLIHHEGEIYAIRNACPHMGSGFQKGEINEDEQIICPWHHSRFDLETGEVKEWVPWPPVVGKVLGALAGQKPLPVFPTKVEDGNIWIELG